MTSVVNQTTSLQLVVVDCPHLGEKPSPLGDPFRMI
jgi:hypothetical protein